MAGKNRMPDSKKLSGKLPERVASPPVVKLIQAKESPKVEPALNASSERKYYSKNKNKVETIKSSVIPQKPTIETISKPEKIQSQKLPQITPVEVKALNKKMPSVQSLAPQKMSKLPIPLQDKKNISVKLPNIGFSEPISGKLLAKPEKIMPLPGMPAIRNLPPIDGQETVSSMMSTVRRIAAAQDKPSLQDHKEPEPVRTHQW